MTDGRKKLVLVLLILFAILGAVLTCAYARWDIDNHEKIERQYQAALLAQSAMDTPGNAGVLPLSSSKYMYAQKTLTKAARQYAEGLLKFEAENYANSGKISRTSIGLYDRAAAIDQALIPYFNILDKDRDGTWPYTNPMEGYMDVRKDVEARMDAYFENPPEDTESEMAAIEEYAGNINFTDAEGNMFIMAAEVISPVCVFISVAGIICLMISIRKGM